MTFGLSRVAVCRPILTRVTPEFATLAGGTYDNCRCVSGGGPSVFEGSACCAHWFVYFCATDVNKLFVRMAHQNLRHCHVEEDMNDVALFLDLFAVMFSTCPYFGYCELAGPIQRVKTEYLYTWIDGISYIAYWRYT